MDNRLNYFNSYNSKADTHEDQLTRAYLVVLKHSFHAFSTFFEYCKRQHKNEERNFALIELADNGWEIETQKCNPDIETLWLMSILITDTALHSTNSIESVERNARYDGVITFGDKLTMIIENKPNSNNVWFDQLNPSKENLNENTIIYKKHVELEWKEIIKQLNNLINYPTITGYEKVMISDFLSFIDTCFPLLKPFDNFSLCNGNENLIYRRINNILTEIVNDNIKIDYQKNWGYFIFIGSDSIKKIGLICRKLINDEWQLELTLSFGVTSNQARHFYNILSVENIENLKNNEWTLTPLFHFSFMNVNKVFFRSPENSYKTYIEHWKEHINEIRQNEMTKIPEYIKYLVEKGIIVNDTTSQQEMEDTVYSKKYTTLNVCPEFGIAYKISGTTAEQLDKSDKLKMLLIDKINDGLSAINSNGLSFLKSK